MAKSDFEKQLMADKSFVRHLRHLISMSANPVSLAEVFHPWVRWEGLGLDLRVRLEAPQAQRPAAPWPASDLLAFRISIGSPHDIKYH